MTADEHRPPTEQSRPEEPQSPAAPQEHPEAAAPWPPAPGYAAHAPHPPHDPSMAPPGYAPSAPGPPAPYAPVPDGPPSSKPRGPRPWGLWIALIATWAIAQPIGPVGVAIAPDMIMSVLYVGVFMLPFLWAGSLVGTLAIGTVLHAGVRFFRHRWLVVLLAALALTGFGAGFLIEGGSPGWADDVAVLSGWLLAAGSAAGLIVVFVSRLLEEAQARLRRRADGSPGAR